MGDPVKAIFLSYASQDAEAARGICLGLREAGLEVWFDQSELRGGDAWDHRIRQQIRTCAVFVPIVSRQTQARPEGYFRFEWDLADQRSRMIARTKVFILPVCIDDTSEADAEVPESFLQVHWMRLPGGEVSEAFGARMRAILEGAAPRPASSPAPVTAAAPTDASGRPTSRWRPILAIAAAAALALLAAALWWRPVTSISSSPRADVPSSPQPATAPGRSIAVLPFVNMSSEPDQEYFADGLSEELIDRLAQNREIKVISRTSSFAFKGRNEDARQIAAKLGVANLLEGSVRKSGSELRVTAQLIRASDGQHLWSKTYDRKLDDIFKVQDEIASTVASALNVVIASQSQADAYATHDVEAYNLVLKGNYFLRRKNREDTALAVSLYRQAIERDPKYPNAWIMLSQALAQQGDNGWAPTSKVYPEARSASARAVALAPDLAQAHLSMGWTSYGIQWDWAAARSEFERAAELDPGNPRVDRARAAVNDSIYGRLGPEIELRGQELERSPLDTNQMETLAFLLQASGQLEKAEAMFRDLLQVNPVLAGGPSGLGVTLMLMGRLDEAEAETRKDVDEGYRTGTLSMIRWAQDRRAESDASLREIERARAGDMTYLIADVHAFRGETDQAFEWLDRAFQSRDVGILSIASDPLLKNLRKDPRYEAMLRKMNLVEG